MEIRPAVPDDTDAIIAFDQIAQSEASRREFIRQSIESGHGFVAVVAGAVVAYGVLEYTFFGHGFIAMLYIRPQFRRRGLGSALMQHMEQTCTTAKLFTSTNQSNAPMQALLNKLGYRQSGFIENLDEGDPELIYFKRLGVVQT